MIIFLNCGINKIFEVRCLGEMQKLRDEGGTCKSMIAIFFSEEVNRQTLIPKV